MVWLVPVGLSRGCSQEAVQLCGSRCPGGGARSAGVVGTDLCPLPSAFLQADVRMAKKGLRLTQRRSGSSGRMTRG